MGNQNWQIGRSGEELAADYLENNGFVIKEKNFRSEQGEIDLVAEERDILVFVEVKYYSARSITSPLYAVSKSKRASIIHAARTYLHLHRIANKYCRFDVVAICRSYKGPAAIEHIRDAFYVS